MEKTTDDVIQNINCFTECDRVAVVTRQLASEQLLTAFLDPFQRRRCRLLEFRSELERDEGLDVLMDRELPPALFGDHTLVDQLVQSPRGHAKQSCQLGTADLLRDNPFRHPVTSRIGWYRPRNFGPSLTLPLGLVAIVLSVSADRAAQYFKIFAMRLTTWRSSSTGPT